MAWTNYHSHSNYCDGSDTLEKYILKAIDQKLPAFGFSAHAPVNFKTDWCIPDEKFPLYLEDIRKIKNTYKTKIQTYLGLEVDFIPGIAGRNKHLIKDIELDFFIGSVHFAGSFSDGTPWNIDHTRELFDKGLREIYHSDFQKASEQFYQITTQMIVEDKPEIIGHLDKIKMYNNDGIYFNEKDKFYINQVISVLNNIKKTRCIVEVNTRGNYRYGQADLYPSQWILERIAKMDIPVMLNSDCHRPEEITASFEYATDKLKAAGIPLLWAMIDNKWQGFEYNRNGLVLG